jgi:hypothetical protein|tara:strand:+ start:386 stop:538 length:153 start_codon:yes stop_codon:yes gene_type:complete
MQTKWTKTILNKVRKIANKNNIRVKKLTDNDLKEFLNIFVKAVNKVNLKN